MLDLRIKLDSWFIVQFLIEFYVLTFVDSAVGEA